MKLGIYLNSQHRERDDPAQRLAETLEQARLIRTLGFDSIWAGEHHLVPSFHDFPHSRHARTIHSISSSARRSRDVGTSMPIAFALLRLTISSNLVGCWTGRSPGFAPLRILST